jgi:hypothetical protein
MKNCWTPYLDGQTWGFLRGRIKCRFEDIGNKNEELFFSTTISSQMVMVSLNESMLE